MKKRGHIRIIGGRWKSRRVRVAAAPGLRPSADALRETLFNWLPRELDGSACLDLFAGSGALGFEAASRGAPKVVMVEPNRAALDALRACRASLGAHGVEIFAGTAAKFFRANSGTGEKRGFDIVFLDPPFAAGLLAEACAGLRRGLLNPSALVCIESPRAACPLPIPREWHIIREKRCGIAQVALVQT